MRQVWTVLSSAALVVLGVCAASAQGLDAPSSVPLPGQPSAVITGQTALAPDISGLGEDRTEELNRWMDDFLEWTTWSAEWTNRRERGWFTRFRERKEKPDPPAWLDDRCAVVIDDADQLTVACGLLADWKQDTPAQLRQSVTTAALTQQESADHTTWWEHLHLDLLWPAVQAQTGIYGVVGTHATTTVKGRLQVFLAPGVMFVNLPARDGSRVWKIAANYGIGYRLFGFTFPGNRQAELHVNLAKAYLLSDIGDVATGRTVDFAGFSITFTRTR